MAFADHPAFPSKAISIRREASEHAEIVRDQAPLGQASAILLLGPDTAPGARPEGTFPSRSICCDIKCGRSETANISVPERSPLPGENRGQINRLRWMVACTANDTGTANGGCGAAGRVGAGGRGQRNEKDSCSPNPLPPKRGGEGFHNPSLRNPCGRLAMMSHRFMPSGSATPVGNSQETLEGAGERWLALAVARSPDGAEIATRRSRALRAPLLAMKAAGFIQAESADPAANSQCPVGGHRRHRARQSRRQGPNGGPSRSSGAGRSGAIRSCSSASHAASAPGPPAEASAEIYR